MFNLQHSNESALKAWHDGRYLPTPIKYIPTEDSFMLMSDVTGSLGWGSSITSLTEEGKTPLPVTTNEEIISRLVDAWNVFLGIEPISIQYMKILVEKMTWFKGLEERPRKPIYLGGSEAQELYLKGFYRINTEIEHYPILTIRDSRQHVNSKGSGFHYSIHIMGERDAVINQTFKYADAKRLIDCFNAVRRCDTTFVQSGNIQKMIDLAIRIHLKLIQSPKMTFPYQYMRDAKREISSFGSSCLTSLVNGGFKAF